MLKRIVHSGLRLCLTSLVAGGLASIIVPAAAACRAGGLLQKTAAGGAVRCAGCRQPHQSAADRTLRQCDRLAAGRAAQGEGPDPAGGLWGNQGAGMPGLEATVQRMRPKPRRPSAHASAAGHLGRPGGGTDAALGGHECRRFARLLRAQRRPRARSSQQYGGCGWKHEPRGQCRKRDTLPHLVRCACATGSSFRSRIPRRVRCSSATSGCARRAAQEPRSSFTSTAFRLRNRKRLISVPTGRPYREAENAFRYRQASWERPANCGCAPERGFDVVAGGAGWTTLGADEGDSGSQERMATASTQQSGSFLIQEERAPPAEPAMETGAASAEAPAIDATMTASEGREQGTGR